MIAHEQPQSAADALDDVRPDILRDGAAVDAVDPARERAAFLGADLILVQVEFERELHRDADEAFRSTHV